MLLVLTPVITRRWRLPKPKFRARGGNLWDHHTLTSWPREPEKITKVILLYRCGESRIQFSIELVEGVENLQILLGVDANDDGVPEQYLSAGAGVDMEQEVQWRFN